MSTSSSSVNTATTLQNPQIIRINYPRPLIDRKPDEEPVSHPMSRIVINGAQPSAASATVPQIVSILNPTITNVITTGPSIANASMLSNAKKCTFHRQCLHIHSPQSQQTGQQQAQTISQIIQHHQFQLPLQTPPQHHSQMLQQQHQQQIRTNNAQISTSSTPNGAAVNRVSAQANRDAISTNISPQLNAALLQDRYLLLDLVDGSSFYKCIDIQTQKMLVCKIANNPCANLLTAHFRLDGHPNVNYLEKVIQNSAQSYLFFEPSQGDLHSHVRVRKRLRENEARRLFRQMCEVVKTCHEQGIVLRDLKLRKFVFADSERTQIKLESLEDAVVLDNPAEDSLQDKRGCPAYVSPEILRANTTYSGKAADMWSLGVILYTMLVGRYPFNDSEHASLFAKISRGIYVVPDCLSSKARCIIRALLRRDPDERITSEDVLYHPWLKQDDEYREVANTKSNSSSVDDQCVPEWYKNDELEAEVPSDGSSQYDMM